MYFAFVEPDSNSILSVPSFNFIGVLKPQNTYFCAMSGRGVRDGPVAKKLPGPNQPDAMSLNSEMPLADNESGGVVVGGKT